MTNNQILKRLHQIEETTNCLIQHFRHNTDLNPLQQAVATVTGGHSTDDEVKQALQTLVDSPQPLSFKQCAFCLFFAMLNHNALGEDINYWFDLQLGKRKYSERTDFIGQIQFIINSNYKSKPQFKEKLNNYLNSKKR